MPRPRLGGQTWVTSHREGATPIVGRTRLEEGGDRARPSSPRADGRWVLGHDRPRRHALDGELIIPGRQIAEVIAHVAEQFEPLPVAIRRRPIWWRLSRRPTS